jgi:curved DNA-binding protein CbpA
MTGPSPDPWQVLGVDREATLAQIKRAYRRLVKANHPDSAGDRALARFLEIQAAYEALGSGWGGPAAGLDARRGSAAPGRSTRGRGSAPASRGSPAGPPPWGADPDRTRATREAYRDRSRRGTGGSAGEAGAGRGGPGAGGGGAARGDGTAEGGAHQGGGRKPRRARAPTKATIGSTSYDGADEEPFEPDWDGATWYGAGSGTYWTINPKEYADPRKHGPEYLARSRRRSGPTAPRGGPARPDAAERDAPGGRADPGPTAMPGWGASGRRDPRDPSGSGGRIGRRARIAVALIGWAPPAFAAGLIVGQLTGCARYAVSCSAGLEWAGPTLAAALAALLLAALLGLPRLAALAAAGSIGLAAGGLPAAAVLTAVSGGRPGGDGAGLILGAVLATGWLVGVGLHAAGRFPGPPRTMGA